MTENKALRILVDIIRDYGYELDNDGQIIVYTGLYEDSDGSWLDHEGNLIVTANEVG